MSRVCPPRRQAWAILVVCLRCFWAPGYSLHPAALSAQPVQTSFYVSPDGSDAKRGTLSAPFRTVQRALDAAAASIARPMTADVVVYLRAGTFRPASPLILGPAHSGRNGFRLVLRSFPGEHAVVSGGRLITGWTLHERTANIYQAPLPPNWSFRQVYVNGSHAVRARMSLEPGALIRTPAGLQAAKPLSNELSRVGEGEVVVLGKWMMIRCRIAAAAKDRLTIVEPCWRNAEWAVPWGAASPAWIENSYQFLNGPGQWFLDRSAGGVLYYIPRPGEDLSKATVEAPFLEDLVVGNAAHDILFEDLRFSVSNWLGPDSADGYVGLQAGYHKVGTKGALAPAHAPIRFSDSRAITFDGNTFEHLGSTALSFDGASQRISITGNRFVDLAGGAMQLGQIDDGRITDAAKQNRSFTIRDNLVENTGFDYLDTAAIAGFYVADFVAEHNEIASVPHYGISVGWGWGKEPSYAAANQIGWNAIHDFSQAFSDSAAIYTLGPSPETVIHDNHAARGGRGYGCLYPDEGSAYQRWTHNVCEAVREWLHVWTGSIHDNRIDENWADTAASVNEGTRNDIARNWFGRADQWPAPAQAVKQRAGPRPRS